MPKIEKTVLTGWDSLEGNPGDQPYGLPFYPGKKVSVSFGRLVPSFWYEHSHEWERLIITFDNASAEIETAWGETPRGWSIFIGPNRLCFIPSNLEVTLYWGVRAQLLVLYVNWAEFKKGPFRMSGVAVRNLPKFTRRDPVLAQLIQLFLTASRQCDPPKPDFVEGVGTALASRILDLYFSAHVPATTARAGMSNDSVGNAIKYIDAHLRETVLVRELARRNGRSPDHFARLFKISVGMSPKQFVLSRRLEKVRELLQTGKYNVTEAGREVGFYDLSHLNRCFRKFFGCSPKTALKNTLATDSYQ